MHEDLIHYTTYWRIKRAEPRDGEFLRFRLVPYRNVVDLLHLPTPVLADYWTALAWVVDNFMLREYTTTVSAGGGEPVSVFLAVPDETGVRQARFIDTKEAGSRT